MTENKYFSKGEFACKCGCGFDNIHPSLLVGLIKAREAAGIPFAITSGCRCIKHNKNVGGVSDSTHTKGLAADIKTDTGAKKFKIIKALLDVGFRRIGISKNFVHVDIDYTRTTDTIWDY